MVSFLQKRKNIPQVSVLMPVYKTERGALRQAIESILNQTFSDFEFLILDDCPEDSREDVVLSYQDKRIKYIKNSKNLGISKSRNKLIDISQGAYLAVMDHDDISLPLRFEKEVAFLDSNPEIGVVGTWYERFPKTKIKKRFVLNDQIERDLVYHCSILHPSSMIRKSVLKEHGLHYEAEFSPSEDYALWAKLIGKTKFANIPEVLFKYRDWESNTSKAQNEKMKSAQKAIQNFIKEQNQSLYQKATKKKQWHILGFPVFEYEKQGCMHIYTFLKIFKYRKREPIFLNRNQFFQNKPI